MECKHADMLMMKYMDGLLTESEAQSLNVHIITCTSCKEDYMLYESIFTEFKTQSVSLMSPPEGFEERVMGIVMKIEPSYARVGSRDTVISFVFGAFSMVFGAGVVVSMYRAEITDAVAHYPSAGMIIDTAVKATETVSAFAGDIGQSILYYSYTLSSIIEMARYGILAVIAALIAAQCVLYSNNKAEA